MRDTRYKSGFTLVELLVALMVTSIVLAAAATLAYALGTVNDATDDTSQKQAQVRYATLRISELIRHCKLICGTPGDDIVIWKADDNPNNGKIDVLELAYIETGDNMDYIRILEFAACPPWFEIWFRNRPSQISILQASWFKGFLMVPCVETYTRLIPQCVNAQFLLDAAAPQTQFVSVSFDLEENGITHHYQINTSLRGWLGNLLNSSGETVCGDDD